MCQFEKRVRDSQMTFDPVADTNLCEAQLDAPLFERAGKLLQLLQVTGLLPHVAGVTAGRQS